MKPSGDRRRPYSHRSSPPLPEMTAAAAAAAPTADGALKSPSAVFWIALHAICCLISLVLGFRFSRLVFLLIFSPATTTFRHPSSSSTTTTPVLHTTTITTTTTRTETLTLSLPTSPPPPANETAHHSHVLVGRRGIRIRPWPHPDPTEAMRAHRILERVQREQQLQYGVQNPRPLIVVTPTYVRTFQALHLTGLVHTLKLVPYPLTWLVVEAGGVSNETASILAKSQLQFLHIPFPDKMPTEWSHRRLVEARMRLRALRVIRERGLDGIVLFTDDSNMHSMELFDEIQKVKWMGAVSVGILAHSGSSEEKKKRNMELRDLEEENFPLPIQGPACNSSGHLSGWHNFNSLPYLENSATFVGEGETVLPMKLEWVGFVLNSRLLWREAEGKPDWVQDLDSVGEIGEEVESPLSLLKDASFIEPLGNCGKKVLIWWLRVEARYDSKFPSRWTIEPSLEVTIPVKRILWPDANSETPSEVASSNPDNFNFQFSRKSILSRLGHSSNG